MLMDAGLSNIAVNQQTKFELNIASNTSFQDILEDISNKEISLVSSALRNARLQVKLMMNKDLMNSLDQVLFIFILNILYA